MVGADRPSLRFSTIFCPRFEPTGDEFFLSSVNRSSWYPWPTLARSEPTRTASASQLRTLNRLRAEALGDLATGIDAGDPHSGATATKNFASKRAFLLAVQLTGRPACAREAAACDRTVESTQGRETARAVKTTTGVGKTRIGSSPNFEPSEPVRFLRGRPERRRCEQDDACSAAAING